MRATSERNDAEIVIPIVRIPPVEIRAVRVNIANIHGITAGQGTGEKRKQSFFLRSSVISTGDFTGQTHLARQVASVV